MSSIDFLIGLPSMRFKIGYKVTMKKGPKSA